MNFLMPDFVRDMGIQMDVLVEIAVIIPIILFFVMIIVFVVTARRRFVLANREIVAKRLFTGVQAKINSRDDNRQEMLERLLPEEESHDGVKSSLMRIFEVALKLAKFDREDTKRRLLKAGHREIDAMSKYVMRRGIAMFVLPMALWFFLPTLEMTGVLRIGICLIGAFAGGIFIDAQLDREVKERQDRLQTELPVLLDLLTIYLGAGSSFDVSLARVSHSLKISFPIAAIEVFYLRKELEMSVDRERTLRKFAEQIGTQTANTFVAIIVQSEKRGNAVVPALRRLAQDARRDVMADTEKKAQKIPSVMQLPMFLFVLPAIFMSVIGPAIIRVLIEVSRL